MDERQSLEDVFEAYRHDRGLECDEEWAERVAWLLTDEHHVRDDHVRMALLEGLSDLRNVCRDDWRSYGHIESWQGDADAADATGIDASALLGTPEEWGNRRVEQWREDGVDAFEYERPMPVRDVVVYGFGSGAVLAMLFWITMLFHVRNWSLGVILPLPWPADMDDERAGTVIAEGAIPWSAPLSPWLISVVTLSVGSVYRRFLAARSFAIAVACAAAVGVTGVVLIAALIGVAANGGHGVGVGWMLTAAVVYGIAAYATGRMWRDAEPSDETTADSLLMDDDEWIAETARLLRDRNDMTDADVERICSQARSHANDSGATLPEEFGSPVEYAHRFSPTGGAERRLTVYWAFAAIACAIGAAWMFITGGGIPWSTVILCLCFVVSSAFAFIAWRRILRRHRHDSGHAGA